MVAYVARRLVQLFLILLGSSFIIYNLAAATGDPLEQLKLSQDPRKEERIAELIDDLNLDVPPPVRWFMWLRGIIAGLWGQIDFGKSNMDLDVLQQLAMAIPVSFRLVITATILSIIIGITIGIVTALRQYSRFDYVITFISFLFFSLPVFWVAVLMKQFLAIGFNDFLMEPQITAPWLVGISLATGIFWAGVIGGSRKNLIVIFVTASASTAILLTYLSAINWFRYPGLGPVVIGLIGVGSAFAITSLSTGLANRRALYSALTMALLGVIVYFSIAPAFDAYWDGTLTFGMLLLTVLVGAVTGWLFGGEDKVPVIRTTVITAVISASLVFVDRIMQAWDSYFTNDWVSGRVIATVGENTTDLEGDFWLITLDAATHLILPTLALMIISFAGYVRFSRGSLLEVLNQDYIRTARAKGMSERTVVMRHAFRNALIPLATIMVADIAGVIGGALITETVFAWQGVGKLFINALYGYDLNTIMAIFLVTAGLAVLSNLIADLLYGALDPRIRVNK